MKIGLLRQNTLITCPSAIGARSTSMGAPAAMVEASGFICATSGHSAPAVPTAAATPVAINRKSRRLGSVEDIVVTCVTPWLIPGPRSRAAAQLDSLEHRDFMCPDTATPPCGGERPAALRLLRARSREQQPSCRSSGDLLAPLPMERKWAAATSDARCSSLC